PGDPPAAGWGLARVTGYWTTPADTLDPRGQPTNARWYGQPVNLPANDPAAGIPLQLSDGLHVSQVQLTLHYDPSLLGVQAFALSSSLAAAGAQAEFSVVSLGTVTLSVTAPQTFATASGSLTVGSFTAAVPATASYGGKHVLDITDLHVFDDAAVPAELPTVDDDAIHVAAFFGDTSGSRGYNSPDVTLVQRVIGQLNTGFSAYQLADPLLLADITRNGKLQANDTVSLQRLIGQVPVGNVPALPTDITPPTASGADPTIYIPRDLSGSPGDTITVPVKLLVTEPAGITLSGFDIVLAYDPEALTVTAGQLGSLLSNLGFSGQLTYPAPGKLIFTASSPTGSGRLAFGTEGALVNLTCTINSNATPGTLALNLLESSGATSTGLFDNSLQELVLLPTPTNGAGDSVDGLLTVLGAARVYVAQVQSALPGTTVTVAVGIQVTKPAGITLSGFDLVLSYDSTVLTLGIAQIGSLVSGSQFSGFLSNPEPGILIYTASASTGTGLLPVGTSGDLVTISFTVAGDAPAGTTPINLRRSYGAAQSAAFDNDLETLLLAPAPTDTATDSVDGRVLVKELPTVSFTSASQSHLEDVGTMTVTVELSAIHTLDVTIPFTLGGTATQGAGQDYTITPSPITIAAGQTRATITIAVNDDPIVENDETVNVTLGVPTNALQGSITQHTATIKDNDPPGFTMAITGGDTTVSEAGTTDTFAVVLNRQPLSNVVLAVSSSDPGEATVDKAT
ncbi:MAG: cohesin domain-containing protein, partial [Planctomycetota bacterium]|nr:cohesin domain-containing protein [Planctomycetota bacterium]